MRRVTALLAATFLAISIGACTHWKSAGTPPRETVEDNIAKSRSLRLRLADGSRHTYHTPKLLNDSIHESDHWRNVAPVALVDVVAVDTRRLHVAKTVAASALLGVTGVIIFALIQEEPYSPTPQSSCPLVYSWNGKEWVLDSGTFGGAIAQGLARTDVDNLDHAVNHDGIVRLKVANELPETDYVDELTLLVVEHAPGVQVIPAPVGSLHAVSALQAPISATDRDGRDVLRKVRSVDDDSWESSLELRDPATEALDAIELTFERPADESTARLVLDAHHTPWAANMLSTYLAAQPDLDAWHARIDSDSAFARSMGRRLAETAFLRVSVMTDNGWQRQALVPSAGPEILKRHAIALTAAAAKGTVLRVKLEAPRSFWRIDRVAVDFNAEPSFTVREVRAQDDELSINDGRTLKLETGDAMEVAYAVRPPPTGLVQSFILKSAGWYRVRDPRGVLASIVVPAGKEEDAELLQQNALELRNRALNRLMYR